MIKFLLFVICAIFGTTQSYAKEWPTRQIRIIVPFPTGGNNDITARILSKHLSTVFKKPVIVENKPGAGGAAATKLFLTSPLDDHTFIMGSANNIVFSPIMQKQYLTTDLNPVALLGVGSYLLVINSNLGIKTFSDFIEKTKTRKFIYSSGGLNTGSHLAMMYLSKIANIELKHIPYPGGDTSTMALVRNEVDISMNSIWNILKQHIDQGTFIPLASTNLTSEKMLPNVPTISSFFSGFQALVWFGIFARNDHQNYIIDILSTEINNILSKQLLTEHFIKEGLESKNISTQEFKQFIHDEYERWKSIL